MPFPAEATRPATWCSHLTARRCSSASGSRSNVDDPDTTPAEKDRATVLEFNVDGSGRRVYASGIRNADRARDQPCDRSAVGLHERARQPRGQSGPRLRHTRRGRWLLRLAVVLSRRQPGSAARRQASRTEGDGQGTRRAAAAAQRPSELRLLRRAAVRARASHQRVSDSARFVEQGGPNRIQGRPCATHRTARQPASTRTS